ncbi:hypothetical protein [Stackebrandtia nassauensis]|uniref:Uncharacterized protein n=1 Tax=Stackebrandtia nassauensis (strain DSM 44728 / CIP 108903 / NRRL B-16338 / NBRC 102104 / LLR-40K-21) TaxID=446470 RepID=D3Q1L5_STANL|nr:hypothetical protein [Stackebrandtia nassauensis]ADD39863.1 hypothetical protein Snas_0143 [Stackebrandtia nassauensis DSM 44728]
MVSRPGEDNAVPGLPEEWGRIVIPDDASDLEELADEVRFELGITEDPVEERRQRRLPFIVVAVTVAIALVSLFTVPWLGRVGQVTPPKQTISSTVESESVPECATGQTRCATTSRSTVSSG